MSNGNSVLAANLRYLRQQSGLSQEETAVRLGVSRNMYVRYESGNASPSADKLRSLSRWYGVSMQALTDRLLVSLPSDDTGPHDKNYLTQLTEKFERLSLMSRNAVMELIRALQDAERDKK